MAVSVRGVATCRHMCKEVNMQKFVLKAKQVICAKKLTIKNFMLYSKYPNAHLFKLHMYTHTPVYFMSDTLMLCLIWDTHYCTQIHSLVCQIRDTHLCNTAWPASLLRGRTWTKISSLSSTYWKPVPKLDIRNSQRNCALKAYNNINHFIHHIKVHPLYWPLIWINSLS